MKRKISVGAVAATVFIGLVGWFILPTTVAVQIGLDGKISNTLPKLFALLIPVALSVFGYLLNKTNNQYKGIIVSIISVLIAIFTIGINIF